MILVIDNYDSFTFNLVQYIYELGLEVEVKKNDEISVSDILQLHPSHILLSPGPGNPNHAGVCLEVVNKLHKQFPILGVCLGHQIIAQAFGGKIISAKEPTHGKISYINHDGRGIFLNLENPLPITRYHSLMVESDSLPECLEISAVTETGEIAALRHKDLQIEGIQGHPESILSKGGMQLLHNFFLIKKGVQSND
ncbi:anthranilate synthase component II [Ornithinibacillus bavariensis]|uniref:Glutamine amidotransferase n=1 Tax=Ornithinibacillus bavariensis TaxID=545502 RepID=A0A920C6E8_9BACI|nr:aminodeoxychorismate/anthranilate synthase component II [Ornithinibacillus bavariensis]GIO27836.1 glutamine amidotransferase [Ornithinibacillus bavariensis]HAM79349.1 aminodeoxychorismate/anthranilate synthase component II [Ornithinibacillus sp.]